MNLSIYEKIGNYGGYASILRAIFSKSSLDLMVLNLRKDR